MEPFINSRFITQNVTGVQRYAMELSKKLNKMNADVKFVSPRKIVHKDVASELNILTFGNFSGHLWEQAELPIYLKYHNNPVLMNFANTAPMFYRNQITVIHDLSFLRNPGWFSKKFYYYYRFLVSRIARNSLKIITDSEFSKQEIMNLLNVSENRIRVVYSAVSENLMSEAKKNFHNNYDDYILTVSSLDPRKNLTNLISALRRGKLKNTRLVVVGSENKIFVHKGLEDILKYNTNVVFTGYISDTELAGLYRNARLFVYPSFYEGFGLPPLEAMACGCPTVVSKTASLPEVCGEAAYYIDPYAIESIAHGIHEVLTNENLRRTMIKKGLERIKLFSWEKTAKETLNILEEVKRSGAF